MPIKIENKASVKVPKNTEAVVQGVFDSIPKDHSRMLNNVVLVDKIVMDSRVANRMPTNQDLPGLYHPKQGNQQAWCEIAISALMPNDGFFKKIAGRLNYKPNLAYLVLTLVAQHYFITHSYGKKKTQMDGPIRSYVEQQHKIWREKNSGWRGKLFKPLQPLIERWSRSLRKKYADKQKQQSV